MGGLKRLRQRREKRLEDQKQCVRPKTSCKQRVRVAIGRSSRRLARRHSGTFGISNKTIRWI